MGNSGKHSNSSQFFVTFGPAPQCDGKHVVIGRAVAGLEVLGLLEAVATPQGPPSVPVKITACGAFRFEDSAAQGHWYDPPGLGATSVFVRRPRVRVVCGAAAAAERFAAVLRSWCEVEAVIVAAGDVPPPVTEQHADVVLVAPAVAALAPLATALAPIVVVAAPVTCVEIVRGALR